MSKLLKEMDKKIQENYGYDSVADKIIEMINQDAFIESVLEDDIIDPDALLSLLPILEKHIRTAIKEFSGE